MSKFSKISTTTNLTTGEVSKSSTITTTKKVPNPLFLVFGIILMFLIATALIRQSAGLSDISFGGFLNYISNTPSFIPRLNITKFGIVGDWGLFEGLKNFFNIFAKMFGIIIYLGESLLNMLLTLFYFLRYIFV